MITGITRCTVLLNGNTVELYQYVIRAQCLCCPERTVGTQTGSHWWYKVPVAESKIEGLGLTRIILPTLRDPRWFVYHNGVSLLLNHTEIEPLTS